MSLLEDSLQLYTENCKVATSKLLELINDLGKAAKYKIDIQKSAAFLYINNKVSMKFRKQYHLLSQQIE